MATKYFCDGCDMELGRGIQHNKRQVIVKDRDQSKVADEYDLCNSCTRRLENDMNPKKWFRETKPSEAA